MSLNFKAIIEDYCGTGTLSDEEIDFREREHIKTMNTISELLFPSIANWNICEACNIEQGSYWISCNASILDRIRPVSIGKTRAHKLFDALCKHKIYNQRPNLH